MKRLPVIYYGVAGRPQRAGKSRLGIAALTCSVLSLLAGSVVAMTILLIDMNNGMIPRRFEPLGVAVSALFPARYLFVTVTLAATAISVVGILQQHRKRTISVLGTASSVAACALWAWAHVKVMSWR
jgi:hypothetical protein